VYRFVGGFDESHTTNRSIFVWECVTRHTLQPITYISFVCGTSYTPQPITYSHFVWDELHTPANYIFSFCVWDESHTTANYISTLCVERATHHSQLNFLYVCGTSYTPQQIVSYVCGFVVYNTLSCTSHQIIYRLTKQGTSFTNMAIITLCS